MAVLRASVVGLIALCGWLGMSFAQESNYGAAESSYNEQGFSNSFQNSSLLAAPAPGQSGLLSGGDPAQLLEQRFGFNQPEAQRIVEDAQQGMLSAQDLEELCDRITAAHLPAAQIQSAGQAMGLGPDVVSELMTCPNENASNEGAPAVLAPGDEGGANGAPASFRTTNQGVPENYGPGASGPSGSYGPPASYGAPGIYGSPEMSGSSRSNGQSSGAPWLKGQNGEGSREWGTRRGNQNPNWSAQVNAAPSPIERSFRDVANRKMLPGPQAVPLSQYGYSLFESPVSTFAPIENVPVGDNYKIGIGDELKIMTWGSINQNLSETVNRDGAIALPQIGPVFVAGLNFQQAKQLIEGRLGQISNAHAQVTMGRLRTMQVYVLGNVRQPGVYTVSSLSRVSNVLAAAGGITKTGSLRRLELRRNGAVVQVVDLYRMLMSGDMSGDEPLQPGDVVFVPVIGPVVAVAGDVKQPAIYELARPAGEPLGAVVQLSGGLSAFSSGERISVTRVRDHSQTVEIDVSADQPGWRSFRIQDGDLVSVFPVIVEQRNVVTLAGNIYRPGQFEWYSGMRVSDLLRHGEGVKKDTYLGYALIKRQYGPERQTQVVAVDLGKILAAPADSALDLPLRPLDRLQVLRRAQVQQAPRVRVIGEVNKPGAYTWYDNMRLSDLIYSAGGFRDDADRNTVELVRTQVVEGGETEQTHQNVVIDGAAGEASFGPILTRNDEVFVQEAANWHAPWVVQIKGRVVRPGYYSVQPGQTLSDVLTRAGGFLPDAFPQGIVFTRTSVRRLEQDRLQTARAQLEQGIAQTGLAQNAIAQSNGSAGNGTTASLAVLKDVLISSQSLQASGRVVVHVRSLETLQSDSTDNVALENGDTIAVPSRPSSVAVLGQVNEPTSIIMRPGLRVRDYLASAGGTTQFADVENIMLVRPDGAVITQKGLNQSSPDRYFPLIAVVSGGILNEPVTAGSTIYVPAKYNTLENLEYTKSISTIVAQSVSSLAIIGILASSL